MEKNTVTDDLWVVGIGASAGGLEALTLFLRNLPSYSNAAFIIAQHLAPHSKSMMVELLSKQTSLPVLAVRDRQPLKANHIYIVPPSFDVRVIDSELQLTLAGMETRPKPSVDTFFESLAVAFGKKAVGIILSGTGSDGAEGIRSIKEYGGVTLVQDILSAKYDGMPKSAYDTGLIDAIMPVEQLAKNLSSLLESFKAQIQTSPSQAKLNEYRQILQFLKKERQIDFSEYKPSMVQRRIDKRMHCLGYTSLSSYLDLLKRDSDEVQSFSNEMLISVTSFFRDPESFEIALQHLEQIILEKSATEELRVWVAGCATGEEAFSLAFLIAEIVERQQKPLIVKIFGTDLDQEALTFGRAGVFEASELNGLPEYFKNKYFEIRGQKFEIKRQIRDWVVFAKQNLIKNPPFVKMDFISCRNVLIYFEPALQERVFEVFHYALRPSGILFLGKSENVNPALFESIDQKIKIFRRLNVPTRLNPVSGGFSKGDLLIPSKKKVTAAPNLAEVVPQQVIHDNNLCAVAIGRDGLIQHIFGNSEEYLKVPSGQADFRLSNLLPSEMLLEFNLLFRKAQRDKKAYESRLFPQKNAVKGSDTKKNFFSIRPLEEHLQYGRDIYIVTFKSKKLRGTLQKKVKIQESSSLTSERVMELEQEIAANREHLQTVIEELEISNEELQSLNEELSSTNEELQASNEELETTNEELSSTNEELTTLNEEVNTKSSELRSALACLENIQNSIGTPMLVVDSNLKLQRFNSYANQIFTLSPNDINQPLMRVSCQCEIENFEEKIKETISLGTVSELSGRALKKHFQLRIHPYLDDHERIIGAVIIVFDNTESIRIQDQLRSSDSRIRAIIDSSPTLISLKDAMGRYLTVNQAFLKHFNLHWENVIGKTDREVFQNDLAIRLRENDLEVLLKRVPYQHQEVIHYRGRKSVLCSNRFPLYDGDEKNPYAVGVVSLDITAQTEVQEKLKESEAGYRAIIEGSEIFLCRHLPDGVMTFNNPAFCNYFGDDFGASLRKPFLSIVADSDRSRVSHELSKLSSKHPIIQYEHATIDPYSGARKWVRWIHQVILDERGLPLEYQAVGFDVTEIHKRAGDLIQKENFFSHILEYTSDYFSVFKIQGKEFVLDSYNQSVAKARGLSQTLLVGRKLSDLLDPKRAEFILSKYDNCLKSGSAINFEEELGSPAGDQYLSTTLVPIKGKDQIERIVAVSRDITKLKRIEQALREEKKKADTASKAKSDFLAAMSHELRTPLNVITGMSQLLTKAQLKPEHQRLIGSIQRSSKVLLTLIEDVLDLSKIESGSISLESKPIVLNQLIQDVIQAFEPVVAQKGIKLLSKFELDLKTTVLGDSVRLKQVLINLIGNAIKFTEVGSVTLKVYHVQDGAMGINTLQFEVQDTGIGIPEKYYEKIFNRFSQADSGISRKFGGTGLGLAICKQLVELMNGTIGFESEVGKGSLFWFSLQLPETQTQEPSSNRNYNSGSLSGLNVLVVDDNYESLNMITLALAQFQVNPITAQSGKEALKLVQEKKIDLILMDMQMPEMDGLETTRLIRTLPGTVSNIPIIAVTANAMAQDSEMCLKAGMNDYLTKPIEFDQLFDILGKWNPSSGLRTKITTDSRNENLKIRSE